MKFYALNGLDGRDETEANRIEVELDDGRSFIMGPVRERPNMVQVSVGYGSVVVHPWSTNVVNISSMTNTEQKES